MLRKLSSHTDILLCKGPSNGDGGVAGGTAPQEVDKARSWCQKPATALTKSWREGGGLYRGKTQSRLCFQLYYVLDRLLVVHLAHGVVD